MKNKHLLEKVNAVLKEIEDLDYTQRFAVIYVAQKTLEVNPPNQIIRNKLINSKNFNKVIGQIALHINHIMGGDLVENKTEKLWYGHEYDKVNTVGNTKVYVKFARHSKEENDAVLEEIKRAHIQILKGMAERENAI